MNISFSRGERKYGIVARLILPLWSMPLSNEVLLSPNPEKLLCEAVAQRLQQPEQDRLYCYIGSREFEIKITPLPPLLGEGRQKTEDKPNLTQITFIAYSPRSTKPADEFALTFNLTPEEATTESPQFISLVSKQSLAKECVQLATHILQNSHPISEVVSLVFSGDESAVAKNLKRIKKLPVMQDRLLGHVAEDLLEKQNIRGDGLLEDLRFQTLAQVLKLKELIRYFGLENLPSKYITAELVAAAKHEQRLEDTYNLKLGLIALAVSALGIEFTTFYPYVSSTPHCADANLIDIIKNSAELKWFIGTWVFGFLNAKGLVPLAAQLQQAEKRVSKVKDLITSRVSAHPIP